MVAEPGRHALVEDELDVLVSVSAQGHDEDPVRTRSPVIRSNRLEPAPKSTWAASHGV